MLKLLATLVVLADPAAAPKAAPRDPAAAADQPAGRSALSRGGITTPPPAPTGDCPDKCTYVGRMMASRCEQKAPSNTPQGAQGFKKTCDEMADQFLSACNDSCKQKGNIDPDFMRQRMGQLDGKIQPWADKSKKQKAAADDDTPSASKKKPAQDAKAP